MSDSKAEIQGALWRIPPVDDTEPPGLDSPGIVPGSSGHSRSLQLICTFDNKQENMRRSECVHYFVIKSRARNLKNPQVAFWQPTGEI